MTSSLIALVLALSLLPLVLTLEARLAFSRGAWRLFRALGRVPRLQPFDNLVVETIDAVASMAAEELRRPVAPSKNDSIEGDRLEVSDDAAAPRWLLNYSPHPRATHALHRLSRVVSLAVQGELRIVPPVALPDLHDPGGEDMGTDLHPSDRAIDSLVSERVSRLLGDAKNKTRGANRGGRRPHRGPTRSREIKEPLSTRAEAVCI